MSEEKIIFYLINKGINNNKSILIFMEKLLETIDANKISEYIFVMDNYSIHLH